MLGQQHVWAARARSGHKLRRRCQRSLPTELHNRVSGAGATCPHCLSCPRRAEMGTNLTAVDLGAGRTAVDVSAGARHTCALLVSPLGPLDYPSSQHGRTPELVLQKSHAPFRQAAQWEIVRRRPVEEGNLTLHPKKHSLPHPSRHHIEFLKAGSPTSQNLVEHQVEIQDT